MIRKIFYLALILCGVGLTRPAAAAPAGVRLNRVLLTVSRGRTWAHLDLSRRTEARYFTLDHPHRAVIDLNDTHLNRGVRLPQRWGLVRHTRVGRRSNGALRVVFVLRSAAAMRLRWRSGAHGGEQLLIELSGAAAEIASRNPTPIEVAHAPRDSNRDIIVAVDPGHGGVDPGTIGHYGTEEKTITLAIGKLLARRIDEQRGMRAVLTRDKDVFVPLRERREIARRANADLFVSIHCNSVSDHLIKGAQVYILSLHGASSEAARILAERENAADLKGGIQLDDKSRTLASVLLNLSQSATISSSMTAARDVVHAMDRSVPVRSPRVQQAAFVVLKSPDIPSMLVETDYLSDPAEELKLRTRWYQKRMADAIFQGILAFFRAHPPSGTLFAAQLNARKSRLLARNSN